MNIFIDRGVESSDKLAASERLSGRDPKRQKGIKLCGAVMVGYHDSLGLVLFSDLDSRFSRSRN